MKIIDYTNTSLTVKDSSGCLWIFGLFFVFVSGTFIVGLMGGFHNLNELNQLEQTAIWFVALAGVAIGIWVIYSNLSIKVIFDRREGKVTIKRRSFMRNEIETYPLNEITDVEIKETKDDEGYQMYYVEMKLRNSKPVLLTKTWLRDKKALQKTVGEIKDFII